MSSDPYTNIALLLDQAHGGEERATHQLLTAVYSELRRMAAGQMAREGPHTLQATALVHEMWIRVGNNGQRWSSRAHFFGAAAEAMRRILIESARRKKAKRHGGGLNRVELDGIDVAAPDKEDELLAVNEALDKLAAFDPRKAELVKL